MTNPNNGISRLEGGLVSIQAELQRKEVIETIKQTVARGATDAQLQMFLTLASRYSLDPFLREIWCAQIGGQMTVMTSRDGYLKIAQRDQNFDGIVSATVCENDVFEIDPITPVVKHAFGATRGRIIGAYATCFHKLRRPVVCFAPIDEYRKETPIWRQYPSAMIVKVAESLALKRQFGISGLVTAEEIEGEPAHRPAVPPTVNSQSAKPSVSDSAGQHQEDTIRSTTQVLPLSTVKKIQEEFAALRDVLGDEEYTRILAEEGYSETTQLKSVNEARRLWRRLVDAIEDNNRRQN